MSYIYHAKNDAKSLASALLMPAAILAEVFNARRGALEATGAPTLDVVRETLKHTADVFQVSPHAAGMRALKLRLLTRDDLRRLFPRA